MLLTIYHEDSLNKYEISRKKVKWLKILFGQSTGSAEYHGGESFSNSFNYFVKHQNNAINRQTQFFRFFPTQQQN